MHDHPATRVRPGRFVEGLFRVYGVARWTRSQGRGHFFLMTLADNTGRFDAIAGEAAGRLALGQMVHIRGCVLVRRGEPILVVCSLRPVTSRDYAFRLRNHRGEAPLSSLPDPANLLCACTQREPQ